MSPDSFTDRMSDYIDGALSAAEREKLDAHLTECSDCRALVRDLRSVRREARSLPPVEPPEQVWDSIAARIRTHDGSALRRSSFHTALAVAAALVLGVSLWIAIAPREPGRPYREDPEALADMVTEELRAAEAHYENAITGLEQIIAQNEGSLPIRAQSNDYGESGSDRADHRRKQKRDGDEPRQLRCPGKPARGLPSQS